MTSEPPPILPEFTMALWLTCLCVGAVGLKLPYPHAPTLMPEMPPVVAQIMNVQVTRQELPAPQSGASSAAPVPPIAPPAPAPPILAPPDAPLMESLAVAPPLQIAFARPAPTPVARAASMGQPAPPAKPSPPAIQQIVYGQGEGRQPAPEYPREAAIDRQEGTVVIIFHVGEDGSVLDAQAVSSCPWPLLNQSALRAVRETWRFVSGPPRTYQVSIQFQLRRD